MTSCLIAYVIMVLLTSTMAMAQPAQQYIDGELLIVQREDAAGTREYVARTAEGATIELKLDATWADPWQYWQYTKSGSRVRARGWLEGATLRMSSPYHLDVRQGGSGLPAHQLPDTTGVQNVLVMMTRYAGAGLPFTPAAVQANYAGPVHDALDEFSFGQMGIAVTTTAGFALANYQRHVYVFAFNSNCEAGIGTLDGTPSLQWVNGAFALAPKIPVHEFGHNLGLFHSHAMDCTPAIVSDTCAVIPLGYWLDTMGQTHTDLVTGNFTYPHFAPAQKQHLGWLGGLGPPIVELTSSGVYRIGPYAEDSDEPKALQLPYASLPGMSMYVATRQPFGTEAFLEDSPLITNGVVLDLASPDGPDTTQLLDAHPLTTTWDDAALRVGEVYDEPGAGFRLHVLEANTDGATVAVDLDSDAISLTLLSPWFGVWTRGSTLLIEVLVQVGDQPAEGGVWEWGVDVPGIGFFLQPHVTLGADGIWTLEILLPLDLPVGIYQIFARASWESKVTPIVSGQLTLQ